MGYKIIDYDCLSTDNTSALRDRIKEKLEEGWELFSDTKFQTIPGGWEYFFQAFIKVEQEE